MKTMNNQRALRFACSSALLSVALTGAANAGVVNLGRVQHLPARPTISYTGTYGKCFNSAVDSSGMRTIIEVDIFAAMQSAAPGMILKSITIQDTGTNAYGASSPGADMDFFSVQGADTSAQMAFSYNGPVAQHMNESSATLASRLAAADAIVGDSNTGMSHFVSLGLSGAMRVDFSSMISIPPSGSGGDGSSGPGSSNGGGGSGGGDEGSTQLIQGLLVAEGMRLWLSEAGAGEQFDITFEFSAVPAPGALALLGLSGLVGCTRRRPR